MTEEIRLTLFVEIMALCSFVDTNVMEERFLSIFSASQWMDTYSIETVALFYQDTRRYISE